MFSKREIFLPSRRHAGLGERIAAFREGLQFKAACQRALPQQQQHRRQPDANAYAPGLNESSGEMSKTESV
jgi:hypothetical protein